MNPTIKSVVPPPTPVQYFVRFKGYPQALLSIEDGSLKLASESGETIWMCPVSDITKVIDRRTLYMDIYAEGPHAAHYTLVFGEYKTTYPISGGYNMAKMDDQARPRMQPWLDYFRSQGVLVEGFNIHSFNKIGFYVSIALFLLFVLLVIINAAVK
jgi:hypothetical protein